MIAPQQTSAQPNRGLIDILAAGSDRNTEIKGNPFMDRSRNAKDAHTQQDAELEKEEPDFACHLMALCTANETLTESATATGADNANTSTETNLPEETLHLSSLSLQHDEMPKQAPFIDLDSVFTTGTSITPPAGAGRYTESPPTDSVPEAPEAPALTLATPGNNAATEAFLQNNAAQQSNVPLTPFAENTTPITPSQTLTSAPEPPDTPDLSPDQSQILPQDTVVLAQNATLPGVPDATPQAAPTANDTTIAQPNQSPPPPPMTDQAEQPVEKPVLETGNGKVQSPAANLVSSEREIEHSASRPSQDKNSGDKDASAQQQDMHSEATVSNSMISPESPINRQSSDNNSNPAKPDASATSASDTIAIRAPQAAATPADTSGLQPDPALTPNSTTNTGTISGMLATAGTDRTIDAHLLREQFDLLVLSALKADQHQIRIQMEPASLGRLTLECRESQNGLELVINTESPAIRDILSQQEQPLRLTLEAQGLQLGQFSVSCEDKSPQQQTHRSDESFERITRQRMRTTIASKNPQSAQPTRIGQTGLYWVA
jgi:flagellar hook-length control protein FliK